ncbi:HVA1 family protein [Pleurocapsa sp. PCC 7319]|uniref:HVA1 family protein n=1 Tax=Pleurocapsa sp. PCC 7319 TaxID=118161 RepID=UPI0003464B58|nr:HVA1 family protein [Pleurocapsa sp. PCC 7319]
MIPRFNKGDHVKWNSGGGQATGKITKKITQPTEVEGKKIDATQESPRYLVKNDNTKTLTGHKAESLSLINENLTKEQQEILQDFQEAVNMSSRDLQQWLKTEQSKSVGQKKDEDSEAIGHKSGKQIVEILERHQSNYTDSDFSHMKRVISYVHRHLAQKPSGNIDDSRWRYSLMNWGHDPLKD